MAAATGRTTTALRRDLANAETALQASIDELNNLIAAIAPGSLAWEKKLRDEESNYYLNRVDALKQQIIGIGDSDPLEYMRNEVLNLACDLQANASDSVETARLLDTWKTFVLD